MSDIQKHDDDVIAKEITIAVVQSMELGKYISVEEIPEYVSNLYKTILKAVSDPK